MPDLDTHSIILPVAMSEEKQMAVEFRVSAHQEANPSLVKTQKSQTPQCLLLFLCLYMIATAISLWYLTWCEWLWGDLQCL